MSDELKSSDSQPPEADLAAVLTYVRELWGNQNGARPLAVSRRQRRIYRSDTN
jgi:hypothetical protein